MRTETPDTGAPLGRFRGRAARAGRWITGLPPATRLGLVLAPIALALVIGYSLVSDTSANTAWIFEGNTFSSDEVMAIARVLDGKGIVHRTDDQGRIAVPTDRLREALDAIDKKKVGPLTIESLEQEYQRSNLFETAAEREDRRNRVREQILEIKIRELDGIDSAHVSINRVKTRGGLHVTVSARATVYLKTERDRKLGAETIQAIQMLVGSEPDLKPDAVNVLDRKGHPYLAAGNPSLGVQSLARARQQELADTISEQLDWIKGIRVTVRIDAPAPPPPVPTPIPAAGAPATAADEIAAASSVPPLPPVAIPAKTLANRPLSLEDTESSLAPPAVEVPPVPVAAEPVPEPTPMRWVGKSWVLVQVPRSHYLRAFREVSSRRSPTPDDLQPYLARTSDLIQTTVSALVPPDELGEVQIHTIPDELVETRAPAPPARTDDWKVVSATLIQTSGAVAVVALILLAIGRMVRRPVVRVSLTPRRGGAGLDLAEDLAAGPGPSERVRDLVRRSPEAAAGVLQRWIGQGGHLT